MKKLLSLTLIFAAVLTLGLTGCKNSPDEDDGLSGKWTKSITFRDDLGGRFSVSGNTVTFVNSDYSKVNIESDNSIWWWTPLVSNSTFTGIKLEMSCTSRTAGHGLLLVDTTDENHYYKLMLRNGYILLSEEFDDDSSPRKDLISDKGDGKVYYWGDWNTKINQEPQKNEVIFYTLKDGSMKLMVNGETITTLSNPPIKSFYLITVGQVAYADKTANATVKDVYEFKKFQTAK